MRSDQELLAIAQKHGITKEHLNQAPAPQQDQTIAGLLGRISPLLRNTVVGAAEGYAGKSGGTDLAKLYQEQAIKKSFEDPYEKAIKEDYMKSRIAANNSMAPLNAARAETAKTSNDLMRQVLGGKDGSAGMENLPPGTTMKAGPMTIPVNRELNSDELAAVSAKEVFTPISQELKDMTAGGVYQSKLGDMGRTFRQAAAGQPNALLTSYDPKLQAIQGKINSMRRYVFGEGGKQLTGIERDIVMALVTPTGKSDEQIISDLDEAVKIINSKSKLALGGANAVSQIPQEAQKLSPGLNDIDAELAEIDRQLAGG